MSCGTFKRVSKMHFDMRAFFVAAILISGMVFASQVQAQTQQTQEQTNTAQQSTPAQENQHGTGIVPPGVKLVPAMPAGQTRGVFHFPNAATRTLTNGLRVFVVTDHRQPAVAVRLVLMSAGAIHDPAGTPGIASMTADMLTQGTTTRSAQQFAEAIDFVGGHIDAGAGDDATSASLTVVSRDLDLGMDLLSDAVLHPAFAQEELERQRQQTLSGLRVNYSDPSFLASAVFDRTVYGSSPYGLPGDGTPETVAKITRDDLMKFHDGNYAPNDTLIAFSGDVTPERAFALAEKYFGSWQKKEIPQEEMPAPAPTTGLHFIVIDKPDAVQTQIRVGKLGIRRNNPDYIPLLVTNRIFGGGYNSRLNTEVRIKKGLTYGANSSFDSNRFAGDFVADTFTRTPATAEATKLVVDLIAQMSTGDAKPEELKFAQDYLSGVYPIQSETASQVAGRILAVAEYGLPQDYNDTYQQKILDVTDANVREMAKQYFNAQDLDVVLVGNASQFLPALKTEFPNAQWQEIPYGDLNLLSPDLRQPKAAAPAPTPESLAKGHDVVMAAAQAAGGDALRNVSAVEFTEKGNIYAPQGALAIDVKWQVAYPDKVHATITLPMGEMNQVSDGKSAWVQSPQGTREVSPEAFGEFQRGISLFGAWGFYQQAMAGKVQAQYLGEEEVDGKKAEAVNWLASFGVIKLYFDSATHLLIAAKYKSGTEESDQRWSDFRAVDGRQFPYQSVTYRSGAKFTDATVQDVHVNPTLDPSLFAKPAPPPPASKP